MICLELDYTAVIILPALRPGVFIKGNLALFLAIIS
jgi:hypothetical protein